MSHTYSQIYLHIVWSTKNREKLIKEEIEEDIKQIIKTKAKKYNSEVIAIGNTFDHIHVLIKISTKTVISEMIRELKGSTSYFVNNSGRGNLFWQNGYGVLSVSLPAVETVEKYVQNQKNKHLSNDTIEYLEKINL